MAVSAAPTPPRFEHRTESGPTLGMGSPAPRLSWVVDSAEAGWTQTAYEVEVARTDGSQSYRVDGADQVLVPWPAAPLRSRETAHVRVRVTGGAEWSEWSGVSVVEAGLLATDDWSAEFISPSVVGGMDMPAPQLSATVTVPGDIRSARLYATAHGIYTASINGRRVDDTVLAPGWTSYEHRLRYHAYDVTDHLTAGVNTIDVVLGNGWWRGRLGYVNDRALYGDRLALLAQLEITTADGQLMVLATDNTWVASETEIVSDDLYDGQHTDLRRAGPHGEVSPVEVVDADLTRLVAADGPAIRPTGILPALKVWTSPSGRHLVDFGQNAVGWVRLRVRGHRAGTEIVVRHAEVLEDGELSLRPLRSAKATDSWILAGPAEQVLEPTLTLHGFRYADVHGVAELDSSDIELVVIGSDLRRTGWFSSSHELVNQLHENVVWSTRGNFVDLPTDCPQRDERLGWTGDIQVFAPTAGFLYDTAGLLTSWLADLSAEQRPNGAVPHVVPDVNRNPLSYTPTAAWGDAAAIVPWTIYQRTGDIGILQRQLPSMRAWVDCVAAIAGPHLLWTGGFQYGDWLDPSAPPEEANFAKADPDLVATAHFARSAWIVAETARVLGLADVESSYRTLSGNIRDAFARAFVTPSGRVASDAQTAYALAIEWDLLPEPHQRTEAGRRLADLVRTSGFRIATGFVGTPLVCDALTNTGHARVAHQLLLQTQCPSWLYPVTMGATTIWERWDSLLPDGSVNPGGMTSFNHYALGAVADWLHRSVAGLAPGAPGYRTMIVRPCPVKELTWASARHLTPYGEASVAWERADGRLTVRVHVPVGAAAEVHLPGQTEVLRVAHGDHRWEVTDSDATTTHDSHDWSGRTVRSLLDDPIMWPRIADAAVRSGLATSDAHAARILTSYLNAPAGSVATAYAPDERFHGAAAIRQAVELLLTPDS